MTFHMLLVDFQFFHLYHSTLLLLLQKNIFSVYLKKVAKECRMLMMNDDVWVSRWEEWWRCLIGLVILLGNLTRQLSEVSNPPFSLLFNSSLCRVDHLRLHLISSTIDRVRRRVNIDNAPIGATIAAIEEDAIAAIVHCCHCWPPIHWHHRYSSSNSSTSSPSSIKVVARIGRRRLRLLTIIAACCSSHRKCAKANVRLTTTTTTASTGCGHWNGRRLMHLLLLLLWAGNVIVIVQMRQCGKVGPCQVIIRQSGVREGVHQAAVLSCRPVPVQRGDHCAWRRRKRKRQEEKRK